MEHLNLEYHAEDVMSNLPIGLQKLTRKCFFKVSNALNFMINGYYRPVETGAGGGRVGLGGLQPPQIFAKVGLM